MRACAANRADALPSRLVRYAYESDRTTRWERRDDKRTRWRPARSRSSRWAGACSLCGGESAQALAEKLAHGSGRRSAARSSRGRCCCVTRARPGCTSKQRSDIERAVRAFARPTRPYDSTRCETGSAPSSRSTRDSRADCKGIEAEPLYTETVASRRNAIVTGWRRR